MEEISNLAGHDLGVGRRRGRLGKFFVSIFIFLFVVMFSIFIRWPEERSERRSPFCFALNICEETSEKWLLRDTQPTFDALANDGCIFYDLLSKQCPVENTDIALNICEETSEKWLLRDTQPTVDALAYDGCIYLM